MKIGVLTTSYPSGPDDPAGHFVRGFSTWLAAHVGEVEVLALDEGGSATAKMQRGGLPDRLRGPRGALAAAQLTARLVALARRRADRWDAIVSHWLLPCGVVGQLLARGRRHLAIAHGSDVALLRKLPGGLAIARQLAQRAELVYVADALQIPGAPGRVIAMPAQRAWQRTTTAERHAARTELGLQAEARLVVLFVGRLVPDKGLDLLLAALPEGALALIVGDGPERTRLASPPEQVRWLGPRFGEALRAAYAAADLLVVPSRRDGAPTVVAEARAVGLPVLATSVGGLAALVDEADRCVAPTAAALRSALVTYVEDRSQLRRSAAVTESWAEVGPRLWGSAGAAIGVTTQNLKTLFY